MFQIKIKKAVRLGWIYISWVNGTVSGCLFEEGTKPLKEETEDSHETEESNDKFYDILLFANMLRADCSIEMAGI